MATTAVRNASCLLGRLRENYLASFESSTIFNGVWKYFRPPSRLRPSLTSTSARGAHFQFVPETPNPADGNKFWSWQKYWMLWLVAGPTEKMTLLQSVTDALDIALTKVSHVLIIFASSKCTPCFTSRNVKKKTFSLKITTPGFICCYLWRGCCLWWGFSLHSEHLLMGCTCTPPSISTPGGSRREVREGQSVQHPSLWTGT